MKRLLEMLEGLNAMSLALGVIIGGAVGKVVTSLTSDILMPIIGLAIPGGTWREIAIPLTHNADGSVAKAIGIGPFMGSIVDFLIIATIVGWLTRLLVRPKPAAPSGPSNEEKLLAEIRDALRSRAGS